jgi:aspartyl/asparaginyl beta-hydroxylase (cupin superfamily)
VIFRKAFDTFEKNPSTFEGWNHEWYGNLKNPTHPATMDRTLHRFRKPARLHPVCETRTGPTMQTTVAESAPKIAPSLPLMVPQKSQVKRFCKKAIKRAIPFIALVAIPLYFELYWIPIAFAVYFAFGLIDVMRNTRRTPATIDRYFFGNGFFTWLLAPFNLLVDLICLPFRNKGIYNLEDLPKGHQEEIQALIAATQSRDLLAQLESKMGDKKRGMIFFKWYGMNVETSLDVPEFHAKWKYIRTIGISIFNKKQSTGKHYGPLRVSLRVLYNINDMQTRDAYIRVGTHTHYWCEKKLFIFDDTLQHRSVNETDGLRACMFVDILRPSMMPWLNSAILASVRMLMAPVRAVFYKHWTFIK